MKTNDKEKIQEWLISEINKDKVEIEKLKKDIIKDIKKTNKEKIFKKEEEKLTVWQKFKKVLMGI
jgi:hypothetical protein